jgi:putative phosphoesterase
MEVALISDPHIPSRETAIPEPFADRIQGADHVIHAGDFDSKGALADQRVLAGEMTAVHGNMDPEIGLPSVATVERGGVEFVITHGTGSPGGWDQRVAEIVREHGSSDDAVGVAGHTHEVRDTTHEGIRLLNPGSVTGAAPARETSMMTATVQDGTLEIDVHRL